MAVGGRQWVDAMGAERGKSRKEPGWEGGRLSSITAGSLSFSGFIPPSQVHVPAKS